MTQCSYLYASGLRVKSGEGVVTLDGKALRVVRDGKGKSRRDRPSEHPQSDGEITLKDLKAELARRGLETIRMTVPGTGDAPKIRAKVGDWGMKTLELPEFSVELDPGAALGRQGRQADFQAALDALGDVEKEAAAAYQLMTLPYSDQASRAETEARVACVCKTIDITAYTSVLTPEFAMYAPREELEKAIAAARVEDALWFAKDHLSDEWIAKAVEADPAAVKALASDRLTAEQRAYIDRRDMERFAQWEAYNQDEIYQAATEGLRPPEPPKRFIKGMMVDEI